MPPLISAVERKEQLQLSFSQSTRLTICLSVNFNTTSFHLRRDSRGSIAYSEELISSTISVTLQSTDRHHGIVGQERCHN